MTTGHCYRSYSNANWEFNNDGLMALRFRSINDLPIPEPGQGTICTRSSKRNPCFDNGLGFWRSERANRLGLC